MARLLGDISSIIETIEEKKELVQWLEDVKKRYEDQVSMGLVGTIDMDSKMAMEFFKTAITFWNAEKPSLPETGRPIPALIIIKSYVCINQIASLKTQLRASGLLDIDREASSPDE
jgi:hypothetical protein